jgi:hypothetical protein
MAAANISPFDTAMIRPAAENLRFLCAPTTLGQQLGAYVGFSVLDVSRARKIWVGIGPGFMKGVVKNSVRSTKVIGHDSQRAVKTNERLGRVCFKPPA